MFYKTRKVYITKYMKSRKIASVCPWQGAFQHAGRAGAKQGSLHPLRLRHHVRPRPVFCEVIPLRPAFGELFGGQTNQHFAEKPFVFGQEATTVLHSDVQCSPLHLW